MALSRYAQAAKNKVRAGGKEREDREAMLATVCETLSCAPVHHLGKILILYRPMPGNVQSTGVSADERPKRKASEPYNSKKLAAEGKTVSKTRKIRYEPNEPVNSASRFDREGLNKAGKPVRPSTKPRQSRMMPMVFCAAVEARLACAQAFAAERRPAK